MPSRWTCLAILVFWLTVNGFLFWKEVWPWLLPGQPPPFAIDLVDEVERGNSEIVWVASFNDREDYKATTRVTYDKTDETFRLTCRITPRNAHSRPKSEVLFDRMDSSYHITHDGKLLDLEMVCKNPTRGGFTFDELRLHGVVQRGLLRMELNLKGLPSVVPSTLRASPVPVPKSGSVLLPLHPVNRIRGLRPGQTWTVPLLDSFAALSGSGSVTRSLHARVTPAQELITYQKRNYGCLIIEYEGEDISARTVVREMDGLVLRQEYSKGSEQWSLQRE